MTMLRPHAAHEVYVILMVTSFYWFHYVQKHYVNFCASVNVKFIVFFRVK